MRVIAVLAKNLHRYRQSIPHILPGLERYHKVKFRKRGHNYVCDKFLVIPALTEKSVISLYHYQLIKFGDYYENEDHDKIVAHHDRDVLSRMNKK